MFVISGSVVNIRTSEKLYKLVKWCNSVKIFYNISEDFMRIAFRPSVNINQGRFSVTTLNKIITRECVAFIGMASVYRLACAVMADFLFSILLALR